MKPAAFLKLIGAPWAAYHDHPDAATAADMASIRTAGSARHYRDVCDVYGCDSQFEDFRAQQRARRDLIAASPDLYAYAAAMAAQGDTQAKMLLQRIHGESPEASA